MRTTFTRQTQPTRGVRSWWGKAWQRAVEEAAYSDAELRPGRAHARRGDVGAISVEPGVLLAACRDGDDAWTVQVGVPLLEEAARTALVEAVAAESGRIAELLAGNLPHDLVEHAEEVGVELLPYGGELSATCTCPHYLDPCPHAIAVLIQAGWLVDADPLVLFALRGVERDQLLADLHARTASVATSATGSAGPPSTADLADDVELVVDAAVRAQRLIALFEAGAELPDGLL
ncbi:SWIM zinc finger family protein [Nocardioides daeguensis]|uniref:SWIM-type domain-containing protein n=1 Tax=Nocardioides daeguensis TaxID=908359 RepID=A0ABP6WHZ8_9ACTN|nr:SWIM zinc finger family protein [Nocardioides daeguensis]MBV6727918.1 SWIM zinc finger family protein [Nocardioides daeguensis]MCR1771661.1 SWIM zinc finger family protein [Nocardioides daeguensis]